MLWRGVSIEPEWVLLVLLVIAVALGRGRTFIADWTPFLLLFLAYEAMRGFAAKTNFQPHDLSGLERWVFAGTIPTLVLQHDFYHPGVVGVQDIVAMLFYFMHFVLPIVVGFIFWVTSREYYWRFVAALLLMCFLAFVTYLFWPSAPPWYQLHDVVKTQRSDSPDSVGLHARDAAISQFQPERLCCLSISTCCIPDACSGLRMAAISIACGGVGLMERSGDLVDRLPRRALRRRRPGLGLLRCRRHDHRRDGKPPAGTRCQCYACQTFRMIERASLSGSWWEGIRMLTTSAPMKRTSGCLVESSGVKITCD